MFVVAIIAFVFCLQEVTPMLSVVVVPRLPRGAAVEWHVLATVSDPANSHFSTSAKESGYQATLNGSISSCKTNASLVLTVSSSPHNPVLDWHQVKSLVNDVLQKASSEFFSHSLIPVCCRTFYRSSNSELKNIQEGELHLFAT